jgi:hypothetical protein
MHVFAVFPPDGDTNNAPAAGLHPVKDVSPLARGLSQSGTLRNAISCCQEVYPDHLPVRPAKVPAGRLVTPAGPFYLNTPRPPRRKINAADSRMPHGGYVQ